MQPSTRHLVMSLAASSLLGVVFVFGQESPRATFERARMLDDSNRHLTEAIKLYNQVVADEKTDRTRAATSLHRMGVLYLRTGHTNEALRAFRSLIGQYPDQTDLAARAKLKLAELAARTKTINAVSITAERIPDDTPIVARYRFPVGYTLWRTAIDTLGRRLYAFAWRIRPLGSDPESRTAVRRGLREVYEPSTLVVVDLDTNSIVRTVPFRVFLSDLALDPTTGLLYAAATAESCVKVIDTQTLLEKASIRLEGFPSGVAINPATKRVYVSSQGFAGNDKLFVIDASTNAVTARLDLDGIAGRVVVNQATDRVYAATGEPPKIRVFDGETNVATEDLPGFNVFAADSINNRIYASVTSANGSTDDLRVLDGTTHRTVVRMLTGQGGIADVALSPDGGLAYVCLSAQNQLAVIDTRTFTELTREGLYSPQFVAIDSVKQRVYVIHPTHQSGVSSLDVADVSSMAMQVSEEFFEGFDTDTLAPAWTVFNGRGAVSLSEAPGKLRFKLQPRTAPEKQLVLARQFRGDRWVLEVSAAYFTGATGGARDLSFRVAFGAPEMLGSRSPVASVRTARARGDWNGCCEGQTTVSVSGCGLSDLSYEVPINSVDSYVWRIKRDRRDILVERSDDGVTFIKVATHRFGPEIDGVIQYFSITGNSHANKDAYVDFDYVRLTNLARE